MKRPVNIVGEEEDGTNWESSIETYTSPCIKQIANENLMYDRQDVQTGGCSVTTEGGDGWKVGGRFRREITYAHLWLIHVDA